MKILVTGAKGFVGKNLIVELLNRKYTDILKFDIDKDPVLLEDYCRDANFVYHLAGVNRPVNESEFMEVNYGLTVKLLDLLKRHRNTCPVMMTSSIQAALDNPYGISKKAAEDLMFAYAKETGAKVFVYRFTNIFGKWCRPNYNSVVATFCHNIANNLPIRIHDNNAVLNLHYINDVVDELIVLTGREDRVEDFCDNPLTHRITLGALAELFYSFRESRGDLSVPDMSDGFTRKLYSTYLSYLPKNEFSYPLKMNVDHRGSFTEVMRTAERGQFSVNISKPSITKGNHWHHTKNEKFLVVSGKGVIRFRKIDSDEIIEYQVSGSKLEVVDIPPGYTHNIENLGDTDMVTFMWVNECFDPEKPDTYFVEV